MNNPKKANIFVLALIIFSVLASFVLSFVILKSGADIDKAQLVLIITQDLIILLIPIVVYCMVTHTRFLNIIPHERLSVKNVLYIILLTVLTAPIIMVVSAVTTLFYPADINIEIYDYINKLPLSLCMLALAVMPAVFEELVFRGVILSNYKSVSLLKAALVSGLFFGLFHMDFYQMGYAFIAGVFFSFLVRYTNSIYASILSHFIINGTQVAYTKLILSVFGNLNMEEMLEQTGQPSDSYEAIAAGIFFTVIATPILIMVSKKFMEHNKNHKLDYELSILQKEPEEFEIAIDEIKSDKKGFADIYFILYIAVAIVFTLLFRAGT
ncbi:MAG: type II CAAX endopeptidase family protein [Clostridia bacterium]|nr:type II CAAX endopeptidase family protein [Clostridia bacterium]